MSMTRRDWNGAPGAGLAGALRFLGEVSRGAVEAPSD
jgi:hypothetical protein